MIRASLISRVIAPLAVALSVGGIAATAEAAPYDTRCPSALCLSMDKQGYKNDRTYFYMTFNGSAVTHYNVRFKEPGGRVIQEEWKTFPGSNRSEERGIKGVPGQKATISIQACSRVTIKFGPLSTGTKSQCTGWTTFTYRAV